MAVSSRPVFRFWLRILLLLFRLSSLYCPAQLAGGFRLPSSSLLDKSWIQQVPSILPAGNKHAFVFISQRAQHSVPLFEKLDRRVLLAVRYMPFFLVEGSSISIIIARRLASKSANMHSHTFGDLPIWVHTCLVCIKVSLAPCVVIALCVEPSYH